MNIADCASGEALHSPDIAEDAIPGSGTSLCHRFFAKREIAQQPANWRTFLAGNNFSINRKFLERVISHVPRRSVSDLMERAITMLLGLINTYRSADESLSFWNIVKKSGMIRWARFRGTLRNISGSWRFRGCRTVGQIALFSAKIVEILIEI